MGSFSLICMCLPLLISFAPVKCFESSGLWNLDFAHLRRPNLLGSPATLTAGNEFRGADSAGDTLRKQFRKQSENFLREFHYAHGLEDDDDDHEELPNNRRMERDAATAHQGQQSHHTWTNNDFPDAEKKSLWVVKSVSQLESPNFTSTRVREIQAFSMHGENYLCALVTSDYNNTEVLFYHVDKKWKAEEIGRMPAQSVASVTIFSIQDAWYAGLVSSEPVSQETLEGGSRIYRIELEDNQLVPSLVQTVETLNAHKMVVWTLSGIEANDIVFCFIPTKNDTGRTIRYRVDMPCYRWQGAYGDYVYSIPAFSPQTISHVSIYSHDYICVANYRDDSGSTKVYTKIMQYSHKENRFVHFQSIHTHGARDCQFFHFLDPDNKKQHYLVVANDGTDVNGVVHANVKNFIYKFGKGRFTLLQTFPSDRTTKIGVIQNGPKFAMVVRERSKLSFYQLDGWRFSKIRQTPLQQDIPEQELVINPFITNNSSYFSIATNHVSGYNGIYKIQFEEKNDYRSFSASAQNWCNEAIQQIDAVDIGEVTSNAKRLPNVNNAEVFLDKHIKFVSKPTVDHVFTQAVEVHKIRFDDKMSKKLSDMAKQAKKLKNKINELKYTIEHSVSLVDSDQKVTTPIKFHQWVIGNYGSIRSSEIVAKSINAHSAKNTLQKVVYTDEDKVFQVLRAPSLKFPDRKLNSSLINNHPVSDLLLKNSSDPQILTGLNTFIKPVYSMKGLVAEKLLNGIDPKEIISETGDQIFETLTISNSSITNLESQSVNGIDVGDLHRNSVLKDEDVTVSGRKMFASFSAVKGLTASVINDYSMDKIFYQAYRMSSMLESEYSGPSLLLFEKLVCKALDTENKLLNNETDLERDFVNTRDGSFAIGRLKIRADNTDFGEMDIKRSLNGIRIEDVLLKNSAERQTVRNFHLRKMILHQPSELDGDLNGATLSDTMSNQTIVLHDQINLKEVNLSHTVTFAGGLTVHDLRQTPVDYLEMTESFVTDRLESHRGCHPSNLVLESAVVKGNLEVETLNGISPNDDLVPKDFVFPPVSINSTVRFEAPVTFEADVTTGSLLTQEGWDLFQYMPNILTNGTNQMFEHFPDCRHELHTTKISGSRIRLDKVPYEKILRERVSDQTIHVPTTFKSYLTLGSIAVNGNVQSSQLNGLDFSEIVHDTFRSSSAEGSQEATGPMVFLTNFLASNCTTSGVLNNYSVDYLFETVISNVHSDEEVFIDGTIQHKSPVHAKQVAVHDYINQLSADQWGTHWFTRHGNQHLVTPFVFVNPVVADDPESIDAFVNGLNVHELDDNVLRNNENLTFTSVTIHGDAKFTDVCPASVNHYNISSDFVRKHLNDDVQTIQGSKTFKGPWEVQGEYNSDVSANYDVYEDTLKKIVADEVVTLDVKAACHSHREPYVEEAVNDVNLADVFEKYWFSNRRATVKVPVSIETIEAKNGRVQKKLCHVDVDTLSEQYLSKSKDQEWTGSFTFRDGLDVYDLDSVALELSNGTVNGKFDIETYRNGVLLQDEAQLISTPLHVNKLVLSKFFGLVDGDDCKQDFVTLNGPNYVTGEQYVSSISADTLQVKEAFKVNQVGLKNWHDEATNTNDDFDLYGYRSFDNLTADTITLEELNGRPVSKTLVLMKSGDQTGGTLAIHGEAQKPVATFKELEVHNHLNGQSVSARMRSMLLDNNGTKPLYLRKRKKLMKKVVASAVHTSRPYSLYHKEVDVNELLENLKSSLEDQAGFKNVKGKLRDGLTLCAKLDEVAVGHAVLSHCFVASQPLLSANPVVVTPLQTLAGQHIVAVVTKGDDQDAVEWWTYRYDDESYETNTERLSISGHLQGFDYFQRRGMQYVVITANRRTMKEVEPPAKLIEGKSDVDLNSEKDKPSKMFVLLLQESENKIALSVRHVLSKEYFGSVLTFSQKTNTGSSRMCVATLTYGDEDEASLEIYGFQPSDTRKDEDERGITILQRLPMNKESKFVALETNDVTLILTNASSQDLKVPDMDEIQVWSSSAVDPQFYMQDLFYVHKFVDMATVFAHNYHGFLAIASGSGDNLPNGATVTLYRYSDSKNKFLKYQTLETDDPAQIKFQVVEPTGEILLYVLSKPCRRATITVYSFKGASGWVKVHDLEAQGAQSLSVDSFYHQHAYNAQLLMATSDRVGRLVMEFNGVPGA